MSDLPTEPLRLTSECQVFDQERCLGEWNDLLKNGRISYGSADILEVLVFDEEVKAWRELVYSSIQRAPRWDFDPSYLYGTTPPITLEKIKDDETFMERAELASYNKEIRKMPEADTTEWVDEPSGDVAAAEDFDLLFGNVATTEGLDEPSGNVCRATAIPNLSWSDMCDIPIPSMEISCSPTSQTPLSTQTSMKLSHSEFSSLESFCDPTTQTPSSPEPRMKPLQKNHPSMKIFCSPTTQTALLSQPTRKFLQREIPNMEIFCSPAQQTPSLPKSTMRPLQRNNAYESTKSAKTLEEMLNDILNQPPSPPPSPDIAATFVNMERFYRSTALPPPSTQPTINLRSSRHPGPKRSTMSAHDFINGYGYRPIHTVPSPDTPTPLTEAAEDYNNAMSWKLPSPMTYRSTTKLHRTSPCMEDDLGQSLLASGLDPFRLRIRRRRRYGRRI